MPETLQPQVLPDWGPSARERAAAMLQAAGLTDKGGVVVEAIFRPVLEKSLAAGPLGLAVDIRGDPSDPAVISDLEHILSTAPLDNTAMLDRARHLMLRMAHIGVGSARPGAESHELPPAPYVLVVDEGLGPDILNEMLVFAQTEQRGAKVVVYCEAHQGRSDLPPGIERAPDNADPWQMFPGALGVYAVGGITGFLAIFAEHKPRIFGQPFYAGWGLTIDENPVARRNRTLTRAQLFAASVIDYPVWYDPFRQSLTTVERIFDILEAELKVLRADRVPYRAVGFNLWKRRHTQALFGQVNAVAFRDSNAASQPLVWGMRACDRADPVRAEDGFLRSRGLGALLVPPLSLVADRTGIYYDASRPSDLEHLINSSPELPAFEVERAERLITKLTSLGLTKYNLSGSAVPDLPSGHKVLVPGQVEDDASVRFGATGIQTNLDLLKEARRAHPGSVIIYKPHPDVVAGLRKGAVAPAALADHADLVVDTDMGVLLDHIDEVWTMTSLTGFEALLRGKKVTCTGMPFYAGWGLTRDLGITVLRRQARPSLAQLAHAVLIGYPRYYDPVTGLICPVEVVVERLADTSLNLPATGFLLAQLQRMIPVSWRR